jgi:hypothetical protein
VLIHIESRDQAEAAAQLHRSPSSKERAGSPRKSARAPSFLHSFSFDRAESQDFDEKKLATHVLYMDIGNTTLFVSKDRSLGWAIDHIIPLHDVNKIETIVEPAEHCKVCLCAYTHTHRRPGAC